MELVVEDITKSEIDALDKNNIEFYFDDLNCDDIVIHDIKKNDVNKIMKIINRN